MRVGRAQLEAALRREARISAGESDALVKRKIDGFFWPMYQWIEEMIDRTKSAPSRGERKPCVCIGLSCVQGGGKTTTTRVLEDALKASGRRCAVVSLDDVYLTRKEQIAVAEANATNPLLQHRGNPGTQDMSLLMQLIEQSQRSGGRVAVPRFDKSLHNGRGDRVPESEWDSQEGPLDVLIIEGWCMGFRAVTSAVDPNLEPVNKALHEFERLYKALDALVVVKVETPQWVYKWREEPESHLRQAGKPALTPEEVRDFVDRFMPAYKTYLPGLYNPPVSQAAATPSRFVASHLDSIPTLLLEIDETRTPSQTSSPVEYNIHFEILNQ